MRYSFLFLIVVLMIKQSSAQSNQGTSEVRAKTFVAYNILDTAFTRNNWEIMAVDMDGGQPVNLTQHKDVAWTYTPTKTNSIL
jgi:hypothetical protein